MFMVYIVKINAIFNHKSLCKEFYIIQNVSFFCDPFLTSSCGCNLEDIDLQEEFWRGKFYEKCTSVNIDHVFIWQPFFNVWDIKKTIIKKKTPCTFMGGDHFEHYGIPSTWYVEQLSK